MKRWRASARVTIPYKSIRLLRAAYDAILPETKALQTVRAAVSLKTSGNRLILEIRARDTTSLRAVANSYLRFIAATNKVLKSLETPRTE